MGERGRSSLRPLTAIWAALTLALALGLAREAPPQGGASPAGGETARASDLELPQGQEGAGSPESQSQGIEIRPDQRRMTARGRGETPLRGGVIKVGAVFSESGPWDARPAERSVRAFFNMVNEEGGVYGRKIELVAYDDGMDASRGQQLVRALVEKDKVFAMVGWMAPLTEAETIGYLEREGVPVIGGIGLPSSFGPRVSFPTQTDYPKAAWAVAKIACGEKGVAAREAGQVSKARRPLFVVPDVPYVDPAVREATPAFKQLCGVEPVRVEKVSMVNPDYTPYVLRWRYQDQADLVASVLDPGSTVRMVQAMARQGWRPPLVVVAMADEASIAPIKASLEGWSVADIESHIVPALHPGHPGAERYVRTLHRYFPGTNIASIWEISWTAAQVFVEGLRRAGPEPTREGLIRALETLREFKADLAGPLTYSASSHEAVKCVEFLRWGRGNWEDVFDGWQCWELTPDRRVRDYQRPWW